MPEPDASFEVLRSQPDGAGGWVLAAVVPPASRLVAGHFPGHPIVPGVALLALVARAAAEWRGADGELLGLRGLKLRRPVGPGDALALHLEAPPEAASEIRFELRRDERTGEAVATGVLRLGRRQEPAR